MKSTILILAVFQVFNLKAQSDTLSTVMLQGEYETFNYFSKENLQSLKQREALVAYQEPNYFKQYFFLFFLNLLLVSSLLFNISKQKVKDFLNTLRSTNLLKQFAQKELKRRRYYLYAYFVLFFLILLSYIYILKYVFVLNIDLIAISIGVLIFILFDAFVNSFTAFLFKAKEMLNTVFTNNVSVLFLAIPLLLLSMLFIMYLPKNVASYVGVISLFCVGLLYLFKEIRNILVLGSFKIKIVSFYFFLYLCTFKILPILLLTKYLSSKL